MRAPPDLVSTILAFRRGYEAAVGVRAATICDGDTDMRDGLIREVDAQFKNLATALGYAVDKLDDDAARSTVEGIMAGHDAMVDALVGER